jgi:hypothetical protein
LPADANAIWGILEPTIRAAETYALPADLSREGALAFWMATGHEVFRAEQQDATVVGTYYLQASQRGGGSHVANCGYMTAPASTGRASPAPCVNTLWIARDSAVSRRCNLIS